jgi:hypothetical protein
MNMKSEREDVTVKGGTPSQPSVVAKDKDSSDSSKASSISKKRGSIHADLGRIGSDDTKKAESVLSKFQTEIGGHGGHEEEKGSGLGRASSSSSDRTRTTTAKTTAEVGSRPKHDHSALGSEAASASAPTLISLDQSDTNTSSPASDRPPTITSGFHPLPRPESIKSNETQTRSSTEINGSEIDRSASPGSAAHSASLLESFRARDKQAIAAQVNSAKSVVRKWGIDFAAKRRADFTPVTAPGAGVKGQPQPTQPQAMYRPQEDDRSTASTSLGHSPNRTLQERLNDAAKAAAIANSSTNRERSHSNLSNASSSATSSRPTLLASPSKSGAVAGPSISEPTFTLSDQAPRRDSTPVLMQPSPGRGMVVPRVVKRPGEVTGLGNSPGQGLTRKISETESTATPNAGSKTPELPPRKSIESDRPTIGAVPSPKQPDTDAVEMKRSDSAPIPSTPAIGNEPNPIISLTTPDVDTELVDTSIPASSGAQDALRKLADKNA